MEVHKPRSYLLKSGLTCSISPSSKKAIILRFYQGNSWGHIFHGSTVKKKKEERMESKGKRSLSKSRVGKGNIVIDYFLLMGGGRTLNSFGQV